MIAGSKSFCLVAQYSQITCKFQGKSAGSSEIPECVAILSIWYIQYLQIRPEYVAPGRSDRTIPVTIL